MKPTATRRPYSTAMTNRVIATAPPDSPIGLLHTALNSLDGPTILAAVAALNDRLTLACQTAVWRMRNDGCTWQQVADALGLGSRQAAQQAYHGIAVLDKLAGRVDADEPAPLF